MKDTRYNPFATAAAAAWAELTTPQAKAFYTSRAIEDFFTTAEFLMDAAEGWWMAAMLTIQLGQMARAWFDANFYTTVKPATPVLPAAPCAGYIADTSSADCRVLVTPAPSVDEAVEVQAEVIEDPAPAPSPTPLSDRIRANVAASRKTTAEIVGCTAEAVTIAEETISLAEALVEPVLAEAPPVKAPRKRRGKKPSLKDLIVAEVQG